MQYITTTKRDELCLDITQLNESISKTFLLYLLNVFEYYSADKSNLEQFAEALSQNLSEWETIISGLLEGRLCLMKHLTFLQDGRLRYRTSKRGFGLYNPVIALVHFAQIDKDIGKITFLKTPTEAEQNYYAVTRILQTETFWNSGMVSVLWNKSQYKYASMQGGGKWGNPYLHNVLHGVKSRYAICNDLCKWGEMQDWFDVMNMYYLFSRQEIDMKFNVVRLQYAQLAYAMSPFVKSEYKHDIKLLFDILWKLFDDAEIAKVYVEENEYASRKEVSQIGREDRTTRLHFIFSLANEDIYSLRVDMPHKGVEYVHLNLQELRNGVVTEAAVPVWEQDLLEEMRGLLGEDFGDFFYHGGEEAWWFRCHFEEDVSKLADYAVRERLLEIYGERVHFRLDMQSDGYELFNDFKYYLKMFLSKLIQVDGQIDIKHDIDRYRGNLWGRNVVESLWLGFDAKEVSDKILQDVKAVTLRELPRIIGGFTEAQWAEFEWEELLELLAFE